MNLNLSVPRNIFTYPLDACMRTLKVPTELQHYIENHEIYSIFADLSKAIITKKPKDVLVFMKNHLENYRRDFLPKVMLIGSSELDRTTLASYLADQINCTPMTLRDVQTRKCLEDVSFENSITWPTPQSENLSENTEEITLHENGSTLSSLKSQLLKELQSPLSNLYDIGDQSIQEEECVINYFEPSPNIIVPSKKRENNEQVLSRYLQHDDCERHILHSDLIRTLKQMIKECETDGKGWILVDLPRNKTEAKALNEDHIIPTHVFSLVSKSNLIRTHTDKDLESQIILEELKKIYAQFFKEIHICDRNVEKAGEIIVNIIDEPKFPFGPEKKKIVIIGANSNVRQFIGDRLAKTQKLVHINTTRISSNVTNEVITSRLKESDCVKHGYVLTGCPRNADEFTSLNQTDVSPNRVIFLQVNESSNIPETKDKNAEENKTGNNQACSQFIGQDKPWHSRQRQSLFNTSQDDMKLYQQEIYGILDYCGKSAVVIDALCDLDTLYARVEKAIDSPPIRKVDKKCD